MGYWGELWCKSCIEREEAVAAVAPNEHTEAALQQGAGSVPAQAQPLRASHHLCILLTSVTCLWLTLLRGWCLMAPKSWLWRMVLQALRSGFMPLPAVNVAKSGFLLRSRSYRQVANKFCRWVTGHLSQLFQYPIGHVSSHCSAYLSLPFFLCK